ncbi:MAG: macro domain-containing protein [Candidatus Babeliales bacterium]
MKFSSLGCKIFRLSVLSMCLLLASQASLLYGIEKKEIKEEEGGVVAEYWGCSFVVVQGDIVNQFQGSQDPTIKSAFVNSADLKLEPTFMNRRSYGTARASIDEAIFRKFGEASWDQLKAELEAGRITPEVGMAYYTEVTDPKTSKTFAIIHAITPETAALHRGLIGKIFGDTYRNSLQVALDHGVTHIAFPELGTGARACSRNMTVSLAINAVISFLRELRERHGGDRCPFKEIRFVILRNPVAVAMYKKMIPDVLKQIDSQMKLKESGEPVLAEDADTTDECPVCLGHFVAGQQIIRHYCNGGHKFDLGCISDCVRTGHPLCPMCRREPRDAIKKASWFIRASKGEAAPAPAATEASTSTARPVVAEQARTHTPPAPAAAAPVVNREEILRGVDPEFVTWMKKTGQLKEYIDEPDLRTFFYDQYLEQLQAAPATAATGTSTSTARPVVAAQARTHTPPAAAVAPVVNREEILRDVDPEFVHWMTRTRRLDQYIYEPGRRGALYEQYFEQLQGAAPALVPAPTFVTVPTAPAAPVLEAEFLEPEFQQYLRGAHDGAVAVQWNMYPDLRQKIYDAWLRRTLGR